jgi:hypothetical protein
MSECQTRGKYSPGSILRAHTEIPGYAYDIIMHIHGSRYELVRMHAAKDARDMSRCRLLTARRKRIRPPSVEHLLDTENPILVVFRRMRCAVWLIW